MVHGGNRYGRTGEPSTGDLFARETVRTDAGFVTTITVGTETARPVLVGPPCPTALAAVDAAEEALAKLFRSLTLADFPPPPRSEIGPFRRGGGDGTIPTSSGRHRLGVRPPPVVGVEHVIDPNLP